MKAIYSIGFTSLHPLLTRPLLKPPPYTTTYSSSLHPPPIHYRSFHSQTTMAHPPFCTIPATSPKWWRPQKMKWSLWPKTTSFAFGTWAKNPSVQTCPRWCVWVRLRVRALARACSYVCVCMCVYLCDYMSVFVSIIKDYLKRYWIFPVKP